MFSQGTSCSSWRTALPIMGPRQTTGVPLGRRKPRETSSTPYFSTGRRPSVWFAWSPAASPNMVGMLGPVMSASTSPTFAPVAASATARLVATVDLPTPPLFEATAITLRTPSIGF